MAPKKKATDAQAVEEKRQAAEALRRQCQAAELRLMLVGEEARQAAGEVRVARRRAAEAQRQCGDTEQTLDGQMRAMMHMTVTHDENMKQKMRSLEQQVAEAEAFNAATRSKIEEVHSVRGEELRKLRESVKELRAELEKKALQCGAELRDILMMTQSE